MDPNLHSLFSSNDGSSSSLDPMFSGISLQSLLTFNPSCFEPTFHHSLTTTDDDHHHSPLPALPESITHNNLLIPKSEHPTLLPPPVHQDFLSHQPFNFFPNTFHRLPQLDHSFSHCKRLRHTEPSPPPPPPPPPPPSVRGKAPSMIPQSNLARQRRQKLSEKTRCLQKLMPWDKKMDQATLLEEAYKYVKFLQAQFCVLQSMPTHSNNNAAAFNVNGKGVYTELERLNRNQVLEVLVNSPVAQTKLYSQGLCVFSIEQLSLLTKLSSQRRQQLKNQHQQMSDQASSKTFLN